MADTSNVNANADVAYNATNRSRYFNLPLFVSGDKPSWLVDWNGAIGAIDEALETIRVTGEGDHADLLTIQSAINTINDNLETAQTTLATATDEIASIAGRMTSAESDIDGVQSDLIAQNTAVKTMQTTLANLTGTTIPSLTSRVEALESEIGDRTLTAISTIYNPTETTTGSYDYSINIPSSAIHSDEHGNYVIVNVQCRVGGYFGKIYETSLDNSDSGIIEFIANANNVNAIVTRFITYLNGAIKSSQPDVKDIETFTTPSNVDEFWSFLKINHIDFY